MPLNMNTIGMGNSSGNGEGGLITDYKSIIYKVDSDNTDRSWPTDTFSSTAARVIRLNELVPAGNYELDQYDDFYQFPTTFSATRILGFRVDDYGFMPYVFSNIYSTDECCIVGHTSGNITPNLGNYHIAFLLARLTPSFSGNRPSKWYFFLHESYMSYSDAREVEIFYE